MGKAKVVLELSKADIASAMYLLNQSLTEEQWNKISEKEISLNWEDVGEEATQVKLVFAMVAIATALKDE